VSFGVIICRKCHHAIGINIQFKTTTCPYCTTKIKISRKDIKLTRHSERDLVVIISKFNEELQNKLAQKTPIEFPDFGTIVLDTDAQLKDPAKTRNQEFYEGLDPFKRIAMKLKPNINRKNSIEFLVKMAKELDSELGEFTDSDFEKLVMECDLEPDKYQEFIEQLKNHNIIYEPSRGKYRLIEE
jgi:nucleoid DNA-binding protein